MNTEIKSFPKVVPLKQCIRGDVFKDSQSSEEDTLYMVLDNGGSRELVSPPQRGTIQVVRLCDGVVIAAEEGMCVVCFNCLGFTVQQ